jgi:L-ascorbate metabolism protein UlaG (beta-lactamase superfamily)
MNRRHRRHLAPLAFAAALLLSNRAAHPASSPVVGKLTWLGQACFVLETAAGTKVVMDPFSKGIGYELPAGLRADLITISHEHPDHNNVALATNKPRVLRGLTADKKGWTRIEEKFKDVTIRSVGVYHDDKRGADRGLNTVFVFEVGGVRIVHMGDLGHPLTDAQRAAIGAVDVLLVPVGGTFTIDAREATRLVDQIRPRLMVVPMHYKTGATTIKGLEGVADFLEGKTNVRRETTPTISLSPVKARPAVEIVVLPYR